MDKRISEFREDFDRRLNHVESELKNKIDKWEVRIWFIILIALIPIITFLRA